MSKIMDVRLDSCDSTRAIIHFEAFDGTTQKGENLELAMGERKQLTMPDFLFDTGGMSLASADESKALELEDENKRLKQENAELAEANEKHTSAALAAEQHGSGSTGGNDDVAFAYLRENMEKDLGNMKVAELEKVQKDLGLEADGTKAERKDQILAYYDQGSSEEKMNVVRSVNG